jgi:hypothetical protein
VTRLTDPAQRALWKRMAEGPFRKRELVDVALASGQPSPRAYSAVGAFLIDLKQRGAIFFRGPPQQGVWTLLPRDQWAGEPIPEELPPPALASRCAEGPYDPAPEIEGPNNGLTEAFAEHLWHDLGAGDRSYQLKSLRVLEQRAWREAAERALSYLFGLGLAGPAGPPRDRYTGWSYKWLYEAGTWEIVDEGGGYVAMVANEADVPMFLAAPDMAFAIREVLRRFDQKGGIKRDDIEALRAAMPKGFDEAYPA